MSACVSSKIVYANANVRNKIVKTIEWLIKNAQQISSATKLHDYVNLISKGEMYLWSGFIVNVFTSPTSRQLDSYGDIPSWVLESADCKLKQVDDKSLPLLVRKEEIEVISTEAEYSSFLLIPFNGFTNEFGYLALGLDLDCDFFTEKSVEQLGWFWSIITPYIFAAYQRCRQLDKPKITKREIECIRWASEGKTSWEISKILNISERTANFHLANCIEKTGSINRQQAIVKCLLQGQLLAS